jgi:O-antigen biosynthesis protein
MDVMPRTLFVGIGATAVCYYRIALPALFLGCDWFGATGEPPRLGFRTGLVNNATMLPDWSDYDVIVVQQPRGEAWLRAIEGWQKRGIRVIYEVDDHLHGIRHLKDHDYRQHFGLKDLRRLELTMGACDAVICSTEYIADRYREFNRNTYVCENGLDLGRYQLTRPPRPGVNVGWAGGTGHSRAALQWLRALGDVMDTREDICAVTIGVDLGGELRERFGPRRVLAVPWTLVDIYPAAMTLLDIALAPAGRGSFFRGKSDLRWLEAGALGIPTIANPAVYRKIENGVTGFTARTPQQAGDRISQLVDDEKLRLQVGENARRYVIQERSMKTMAEQWRQVISEVAETEQAA